MSKYTPEEALKNILRNSTYKILDEWYYIVGGSCGNKILGLISYLRNYTDIKIEVISQSQYEVIK